MGEVFTILHLGSPASDRPIEEEHDACGVGFIADLGGPASHATIEIALCAAGAMMHRGARSADGRTGDGAGILAETPRQLLARELALADLHAPAAHLAAVCIFLPREPDFAAAARAAIEARVHALEITPLRWRKPLTHDEILGEQARITRPNFEQLIVDMGPGNVRERMRTAARMIERALREFGPSATLVSCSATSVVYKALLSSDELGAYFDDLRDPSFASRFALFHQRFSTNTSPSWRMVQPFRHIAHNGEINTITGNRAWLAARGIATFPGASDSHDFNVAVDSMVGSGYRVDDAVDMLLAPAIDASDARLSAYYDAHIPTVEPWDGPAAIVFADGDTIGAALDRTGLRPFRWCRTASNKVLCASEAGIVDFGNDPIVRRGRLGPGGRLIARFASGEVVATGQFRDERRGRADFREVVKSWHFPVADAVSSEGAPERGDLNGQLHRFGCTREELKDIIGVLASAAEPTLSMGDDAAPAFFERRAPVAEYLRERFAQVTNPPIDPLRESLVFDLRAWVGSGDINGDIPAYGSIVGLDSAILSELDFDALRFDARLRQVEIDLGFAESTLRARLGAICDEAERAVRGGKTLLVLDDRKDGAPTVPVLLAAGAVHQRLVQRGLRMQASIAAADGYARDAHACAALIGVGANVVTPWLGLRAAIEAGSGVAYLTGLRAGLLKILAKLGICTLRSYIGAQTFESIGLHAEIIEPCFPGIKGHAPSVRFSDIESDVRFWWQSARANPAEALPDRGTYRYRREGVRHAFDPSVIKTLRASAMRGDYDAFEKLSDEMEAREAVTLRDLLSAQPLREPIPLDDVEPVEAILQHFATAAMSLGALAPEVHATIARATNRIGAKSNSGEGGEHVERYSRTGDDLGRSKIKQVASGRFGVGVTYLASADEVEIKMAQGSKPGEGGQIPGHKVTPEIAMLRGAQPGQSLISPPPHHDIYSIEDLAQLIYDLRRAAPHARIAVKLVAQSGIGYVASGVAKADADTIHISGHDGGTGASPLSSIKHAGLPWEIGLVETHHALLNNGLRSRVRLRVDGGFKSGRDVIMATLLGADEYGFGSALLVALGCIYARQCHKNTCPVGIATQDMTLRAKYKGTDEEAVAFLTFVAKDTRRRLAGLGAHSLDELRGRSDLLRRRHTDDTRLADVDLSEILRLPERPQSPRKPVMEPTHLDDLVPRPWAGARKPWHTVPELPITPTDRAVGARLAHELAIERTRSSEAIAPLVVRYHGSAGQSFGAFLTGGLTLDLAGDSNDYVGKSMEGGRIIVRGWADDVEPIAGNTCFYGARGGEGFVRGIAGERFGVRNSGAELVAEGAGDHACEYMTDGFVAILGNVGVNFASGMSGGVVFVACEDTADPHASGLNFGPTTCRPSAAEPADPDVAKLHDLLERYAEATGSRAAVEILADWPAALRRFVKVALPAPAPLPTTEAKEAERPAARV